MMLMRIIAVFACFKENARFDCLVGLVAMNGPNDPAPSLTLRGARKADARQRINKKQTNTNAVTHAGAGRDTVFFSVVLLKNMKIYSKTMRQYVCGYGPQFEE